MEVGKVEPFLDAGLTIEDIEGPSKDTLAYVLDYWRNPRYKGQLPTEAMIARKFKGFHLEKHKEQLEWAIDKVKERSAYNYMKDMETRIAKSLKAFNIEDASKLFSKASFEISRRQGSSNIIDLTRNMKDRQFRYEQRKKGVNLYGIPTGIKPLTDITLGWQPGDFIVLLGKRGTGKTWMSLIQAHAAQVSGCPVLFVSKEMDNERLQQRYDALHAKLPYQAFRRGQLGVHLEKQYYSELQKMKDHAPFYLPDFEGRCTPEIIFSKAAELKCGMVVVDGIYMLDDTHGLKAGWEKFSNISADIKRFLKRDRIVFFATNQLNREATADAATLDNSAYSDTFGQYSDVGMKITQSIEDKRINIMRLEMLKLREEDLPNRPFRVNWNFEEMSFDEVGNDPEEEVAQEVKVGY